MGMLIGDDSLLLPAAWISMGCAWHMLTLAIHAVRSRRPDPPGLGLEASGAAIHCYSTTVCSDDAVGVYYSQ